MKDLVLKFFVAAVPIVVIGWLVVIDLAPGGVVEIVATPGTPSPYVQSLLPGERVVSEDGIARIIDDPVYFSVTPPEGDFDTVTVELAFQPNDQPIVELGGLTDVRAYAFDFRPLSNAILEDDAWFSLDEPSHDQSETVTRLFARTPLTSTLDDFFADAPDRSRMGTYRAALPTPFRMPSYVPLLSAQQFDVSLRGAHEYVTYIKDEDFSLDLVVSDVNRTYGADELAVRVWNESGEKMLEEQLADDGNISENQISVQRSLSLRGEGWPEGVYRVELSGTSDVMWRSFITAQRYMTFKNRLYIGDDVGYLPELRATDFVTNARRVTVETFHADAPDGLLMNGERIDVPVPHEKVSFAVAGVGVVEGSVSRGGMKLVGDGKFAFVQTAFFDPDPVTLSAFTPRDQLEYVYATVAPVRERDGWRVARATFSLAALDRENGALKFALSAPGVREFGTSVDVHAVQVTFTQDPLTPWSALREFARRWVYALRNVL